MHELYRSIKYLRNRLMVLYFEKIRINCNKNAKNLKCNICLRFYSLEVGITLYRYWTPSQITICIGLSIASANIDNQIFCHSAVFLFRIYMCFHYRVATCFSMYFFKHLFLAWKWSKRNFNGIFQLNQRRYNYVFGNPSCSNY